ncbi:uncharacterized protein CTRU02_207261 [Colletotrichum truncatum]|uniref:Uncharacterized protein n=1 Tax=Colletotrichum truncatum TaxID=5467 RepID=A0ACC3Z0I8_COLTU|nr:uncharacterized protein CTRU02_01103 [Colletotrichum truncatum]KAF6800698.1 hypothetical protein CTRU02_01103 [Colletotrichum truncatum]
MVSFFGLKLGADKKKKAEKNPEPKPQPPRKRVDQNLLGEGQFFGSNLERPVLINGSRPGTSMSNKSFVANFVHPNAPSLNGGGSSLYGSRPGTAMSNKNFVANFRHPNAPYLNGGSSSMVDLSGPGNKAGIRPMGSDNNLNMGWNNGSLTNLSASATAPVGSEPGTPISPLRKNNWVHPLDVHYSRNGALSPAPSFAVSAPHSPAYPPGHTLNHTASAAPSVSNAPRSPLGQFEFNLNPSAISKHNELTPAPLSPTKAYPSPPQSVNGSLPPIKTDWKPKTAVTTVRDAHKPGPASLPSPTTSTERTSEEELSYPRPIIQNVAAKRDTLTFHQPRRQSFSMDIDEDTTGFNFGAGERPSTAGPTAPPPRSALRPSPPELKTLPLLPIEAPSQALPPRSPGLPPPRPPQVPYEGPLRSPARPPEDWINARERVGSDARERPTFEFRERQNSDVRGRTLEARGRQDSDPREMTSPDAYSRGDRNAHPQGYLGPPPPSKRVAPGEGERSYGITPGNRRPPPPPVELQRKASNPQFRLPGWDDRDVQHGSFAMISPRMQSPQPLTPLTPNSLVAEASNDANWPLPNPLASPTFGTGRKAYTPVEKVEGQMSPGLAPPMAPGRDMSREQGHEQRRPDFGLRAPTGIADEFRIGFI